MSTNVTTSIDVALDTTEVTNEDSTGQITAPGSLEVDLTDTTSIVEGYKKEYSVVGDGLYASVSTDQAPEWLTAIIDNVVASSIANGLTAYDELVQDVRNAIDSIDVARNTYVEQINIDSIVNGIITSRLQTLNATVAEHSATIVDLDTVTATAEYVAGLRVNELRTEFDDIADARATNIVTTYADANLAKASDLNALSAAFDSELENVSGIAGAVSGLQTYVGLADDGSPDGTGMLASIAILQKQNDGLVETYVGEHHVMGHDDPATPEDENELLVNQWPYALWTPMEGVVDPVGITTRVAYKGATAGSYPIEEHTVYKNTANNTFWAYHPSTVVGGWEQLTEVEYDNDRLVVRSAHVGDTYINYSVVNGEAQYNESLKFIKTIADTTAPYNTDTDGYGWSLVTDNDSAAAYVQALNAYALADGKVSHYYAWGGEGTPADYYVDPEDPTSDLIAGDHYVYWYKSDNKLYYKPSGDWVLLPTIDKGDVLTVFDPTTRDYTNYSYNGTSWQQTGPTGVISKSKFFVDLENEVTGPNGHVTSAISALKIASEAYADAEGARVENKFAYDSNIKVGEYYYKSGFGLNSIGLTQPTGVTGAADDPYDSEFWVNAERLVLKSPSYPNVQATFTVTDSGLYLSTDYTEATRNEPRGAYNSTTAYVRGDVVTYNNSSYTALKSLTNVTPSNDGVNWQLLAAQGATALLFEWTGNTNWPASTTEASAITYSFQSSFAGNVIIRVLALDAEGGVRIKLNSGAEVPFTRTLGDNTEEWYQFNFSNLVAGTNTIKFWSPTADGGAIKAIEVAFVGADGAVGAYTDFLFTRKAATPADPGGVDTWYTNVADVPAGAGNLWSIKKVVSSGGLTTTYADKRVVQAPIIRELTIYSGAVTEAPAAPTASKYNFSTDTLTIGTLPSGVTWSRSLPSITNNGEKVYATTALISGNESQTAVSITWATPTIYSQRVDGITPDALTVTSQSANGVTTLTFSDGTTATINDGQNATSYGVVPIYASDAAGTGASFTQGTLTHVNYYEWSGSKPTTVPSGLTYVKYKGEDGDSQGVIPIYADSATGTNATFTFNNQKFVNFYEWTTTAPTTVPSGLTYTKFVGNDGENAPIPWGAKINYQDLYGANIAAGATVGWSTFDAGGRYAFFDASSTSLILNATGLANVGTSTAYYKGVQTYLVGPSVSHILLTSQNEGGENFKQILDLIENGTYLRFQTTNANVVFKVNTLSTYTPNSFTFYLLQVTHVSGTGYVASTAGGYPVEFVFSLGQNGSAGPGFFNGGSYSSIATDNAIITQRFIASTKRSPVKGDVFTQVLSTNANTTSTKQYDGSGWVAPSLIVDGSMIVNGTLTADHLAANNLSALFVDAGTIQSGIIQSGAVTSTSRFVIDLGAEKLEVKDASGIVRVRLGKLA